MNKLVFLFLFGIISQKIMSQTFSGVDSVLEKTDSLKKDDDDDRIFTKTEVQPQFPGGLQAWSAYLLNKLNYGVASKRGAPAGTYQVIIRCVVAKDGSLKDFDAETAYGFGMETEVIRILRESPKWNPAMMNGSRVNFYIRQPVKFVVQ